MPTGSGEPGRILSRAGTLPQRSAPDLDLRDEFNGPGWESPQLRMAAHHSRGNARPFPRLEKGRGPVERQVRFLVF